MPATQHDALVWLSGSAYDVVFDMARAVIHDLAGQASLAEENLELVLPARSRSHWLHGWLGEPDAAGCSHFCSKECWALPVQSCCRKSGSTR